LSEGNMGRARQIKPAYHPFTGTGFMSYVAWGEWLQGWRIFNQGTGFSRGEISAFAPNFNTEFPPDESVGVVRLGAPRSDWR